ncbi:MAG: Ankyrin-2 [Piccolia ochrophora]|nr:MAG: Ankyrin-2 [Piccolia ochrophora]
MSNISLDLTKAAYDRDADAVASLLSQGADQHDDSGGSALHEAAAQGNDTIVRLLLNSDDIDVDATCGIHLEQTPNGLQLKGLANTWTALHVASFKGHADVVRQLLDAGANIEAPTPQLGFRLETPLQLAAASGHRDVVHLLLDRNARIHADARSGTALARASRNGDELLVRLLLAYGASASSPGGGGASPLQLAAQASHDGVVHALLDYGADINACQGGGTALQRACRRGNLSTVDLLLRQGADIEAFDLKNFPGSHGWLTPLQKAASRSSSADIVRTLLDHGANVHGYTGPAQLLAPSNLTPIQLAVARGDAGVAQLLRDCGARDERHPHAVATQEAAQSATPDWLHGLLASAVSMGDVQAVAAVLDAGGDVECGGGGDGGLSRCRTPLQLASANGFEPVVRLLLERGARVDAGTCRSSVEVAGRAGHRGVVELLIGAESMSGGSGEDGGEVAVGEVERWML